MFDSKSLLFASSLLFAKSAFAQTTLSETPQDVDAEILFLEHNCPEKAAPIVPESFQFRQLDASTIEFMVTAPIDSNPETLDLNAPKTLTWSEADQAYVRVTRDEFWLKSVVMDRRYALYPTEDGSWQIDYAAELDYRGVVSFGAKLFRIGDCSARMSMRLDLLSDFD